MISKIISWFKKPKRKIKTNPDLRLAQTPEALAKEQAGFTSTYHSVSLMDCSIFITSEKIAKEVLVTLDLAALCAHPDATRLKTAQGIKFTCTKPWATNAVPPRPVEGTMTFVFLDKSEAGEFFSMSSQDSCLLIVAQNEYGYCTKMYIENVKPVSYHTNMHIDHICFTEEVVFTGSNLTHWKTP